MVTCRLIRSTIKLMNLVQVVQKILFTMEARSVMYASTNQRDLLEHSIKTSHRIHFYETTLLDRITRYMDHPAEGGHRGLSMHQQLQQR
jgi:hypothetical protein